MIAYPEVQNQAHAELDEVVGNARPPTFADIPSLPYIRAMVKETLRWSLTSFPFGVPHASTADDWYEGMFIPKGTICLQNMRVINSEPDVFGSDAASSIRLGIWTRVVRSGCWMAGRRDIWRLGLGGGYALGDMLRKARWRSILRRCFGRCDSSVLKVRGVSWTCALLSGGITAYVSFLCLLSLWVRADYRRSRPVPFEYKAVPRFAEAEGMLKEALNVYG
jgi:hypothetical protein